LIVVKKAITLVFHLFREGKNSVSIQAAVVYGNEATGGAANWTTRVEEINAIFILLVVLLFNITTSLPISWT
jgi:hypothetical protein